MRQETTWAVYKFKMATIDQARNPVVNLFSINPPNENSSFVLDSRRSPLPNNSSFTIILNLLDLDREQLQELFDDQNDTEVKEESLNEIE